MFDFQILWGLRQWRRQGLMVGEAHLVGEANIVNVKYTFLRSI